MKIRIDVIKAYINGDIPSPDAWFYSYTNQSASIATTRQEVCARLLKECQMYHDFPLWNREIINALFPQADEWLDDIVFLPIVGAHPSFDAALISHEQQPFFIIDLLNIADYTHSVKEMCYILHNLCHIHLLRYLFQKTFPKPEKPLSQLNHRFFCEGFLLYLAWNESVTSYVFHTSAYENIKQRSFQLLYQSIMSESSQLLRILSTLDHVELWDRFPDIAGMFFCDDVYQHQSTEGLKAYFDHGWKNSASRLFFPSQP